MFQTLTSTTRKKTGPKPAPRRALHPDFIRAVRSSTYRLWVLASLSGYPLNQEFSKILSAGVAKATPLHIGRLERIADAIGYPRADIFVEPASEVAR